MSEESTTDWPEPSQTPLFYAVHSERYARQTQIEEYEGRVNRSLIVIKGPIHDGLIPPLSDALSDVDYESPIDLMVTSGGGIPEVALKMATMCRGVNGQRQDMYGEGLALAEPASARPRPGHHGGACRGLAHWRSIWVTTRQRARLLLLSPSGLWASVVDKAASNSVATRWYRRSRY